MINVIEYKNLKEGDVITCEAGGYHDFQVGAEYQVKRDSCGLYLTGGLGDKLYLHEMFKHLKHDQEVVYCMCNGGFLFYKSIDGGDYE